MNNKPTVAISTDFLTAYAALPRQKQGKVTEFFNKFRNDPMHPGINFEKINEGIDKNICSVRIDDTYRGIVVREPESNVYILLWVDHHDEAYAWAKRKKCSINKLTGSVQIFDVQEVIEEQKAIDETALFANISDEVFEKIGLPEEQLPMIKAIKTLEGLVEKNFNGPARVLGGAGTGKTVVAMHRAKMLASNLESNEKILFTTYTKNLAEDIKDNLRKICTAEEMKRIDIINLDAWVSNFLRRQGYEYQIVYDEEVDKAWRDAIAIAGGDLNFVENFYKDEWVKVVQAQEVYDKVSYCKASRIGRGVRLDRKVRMQIWDVFDEYQNIMNEKLQRDVETAMYECRKILENKKLTGQYTSIIVDEGQDLSPSAYRLLRSLAGDEHRNDIFIVGDSHQRIYRNKAVLSKCGINVRGRSSYLRINYRTTEEIRKFAFGLLNGVSFDDLDDDYDNGKGCQSLTHGDKPEIKKFATPEEELDYLVSRIHELETAGIEQKNICIVARTHKLLDSYIAGLQRAGIKSFEIKANKTDDRTFEGVRIATMHRVKGLEFDYVFAVAVNKKVLPFGTRADFEDDISLEEFRTGEKCLLYVALTRARKSACVTCYGGLSELIV